MLTNSEVQREARNTRVGGCVRNLVRISSESCSHQEAWLTFTFNTLKGTLEQVDDVLMVGIRVR
jgi:hypothetical protein